MVGICFDNLSNKDGAFSSWQKLISRFPDSMAAKRAQKRLISTKRLTERTKMNGGEFMKLTLRLLVILSFFFTFALNAQDKGTSKNNFEDELTTFGPGTDDDSLESKEIHEKAKEVMENSQPGALSGVFLQ